MVKNSVIYKLKLPQSTCPATQCFQNISSGLNQTMFDLHEILAYETNALKAELSSEKAETNNPVVSHLLGSGPRGGGCISHLPGWGIGLHGHICRGQWWCGSCVIGGDCGGANSNSGV